MSIYDRGREASLPNETEHPGVEGSAQLIVARVATVGDGMQVRRALPSRARRLIGAWCFLDHFGPAGIAATRGLRVGPHPHIGLQTVTWLAEGEVLHRDSLGSVQPIRPGQLNLMTSGRGISHSEESPSPHPLRRFTDFSCGSHCRNRRDKPNPPSTIIRCCQESSETEPR